MKHKDIDPTQAMTDKKMFDYINEQTAVYVYVYNEKMGKVFCYRVEEILLGRFRNPITYKIRKDDTGETAVMRCSDLSISEDAATALFYRNRVDRANDQIAELQRKIDDDLRMLGTVCE